MSFESERLGVGHDKALPRPVDTEAGHDLRGPSTGGSGNDITDEETTRRLEAALHSSSGIDKLLNRLKQSVHSAREFSSFLRERSILEDRHAQGYKKLVRHSAESLQRPEARQGSFARNLAETLRINERIAENGLQLAGALQAMSDELREMADTTERGRKHWKHNAMDAEKKVQDAENAQQKARDRYNNAAEQYERVRTGEKQGGKFGLKNKSPAQQEEALKEKADSLDEEYRGRTQAAQNERREYEGTHKPQIVRALRDLGSECDAAVSMQLAKLASLTEKNVVTNGMAVAPIKSPNSSGPAPRGLRQVAADIDDHKDFSDFMLDGVEAPPAFKGRSRRNTDAEPTNPWQPAQTFEQQHYNSPSPYNGTPTKAVSAAPQLPQIGGQDFGSSFDSRANNPQSTGPSVGQESGVVQDRPPALPVLGGVSREDSLPNFDRAQASPTYDRPGTTRQMGELPSGPARTDSVEPSVGPGPISAPQGGFIGRGGPAPGSFMDPGKQAPYGAGRGQSFGERQNSLPSSQPAIGGQQAGRGQPFGERQTTLPGQQSSATGGQALADRQNMLPGQQNSSIGGGQAFGQPQNTLPGQQPTIGGGQAFGERQNTLPGQQQPGYGTGGRGQSFSERQNSLPGQQQPGYGSGRGQPANRMLPSQQPARQQLPPLRPVFGVHLDELFRRDGSAVPTIVFACIQAVDRFGLHTEGIYRVPGSTPAVMQLKSEFDHDSNTVQLTNPDSFNNDISAVATLLKNFLRDLPEPLLTSAAYSQFITAAKFDDQIMRRDALHQLVNGLPDPNYATLRVLILHLHGVAMNSEINKMDFRNLSIVFGPTVMGGSNVTDAGWQTNVMQTILSHAHDVFDPDE